MPDGLIGLPTSMAIVARTTLACSGSRASSSTMQAVNERDSWCTPTPCAKPAGIALPHWAAPATRCSTARARGRRRYSRRNATGSMPIALAISSVMISSTRRAGWMCTERYATVFQSNVTGVGRHLHRVPEEPAAEGAAARDDVSPNRVLRQPEVGRGGLQRHDRGLHAGPDLGAIGARVDNRAFHFQRAGRRRRELELTVDRQRARRRRGEPRVRGPERGEARLVALPLVRARAPGEVKRPPRRP